MPELPEVEVVRRGLERFVVGQDVAAVEVRHSRPIRRHAAGPRDFSDRLVGRRITDVRRRGKYLWLPLDSGDALLGHLGMSGQFVVQGPGVPDEPHLRVRFCFRDPAAPQLRFVDQRMFGGLSISPGGAELPDEISHIARDPIDPEFDDDAFVVALRRRRTGVKRALLDQRLVSGIGNIYADEALWRARLHYARPTDTMRGSEAVRLLAAVRDVMGAALTAGGTSFDRLYVNVNGESGYFDRSLAVYGREAQPCDECGTPVRRDAFMNRSSFTCPRCQPRPRRGRW
ncbi:bifunctional DNA-formamidopyrimidine glycosylase/DNA-(apurinic or apyrimidinic site) lyase [Actinopolymorpha alba]|uniref:bifunctional DNA-formamidopyrimidine glycosylase/DNA-(apurinic or apyrimidinic site) lyase n=1 Tax=Actinopolymorpha alba TaxID=533267 RepID=UPI0003825E22|nr:bifunctional DNA-formamidopyrimidine glycosylase/DNA-(apurinic or apyrimidinic site) lyase [Actinopolymorpha alba]